MNIHTIRRQQPALFAEMYRELVPQSWKQAQAESGPAMRCELLDDAAEWIEANVTQAVIDEYLENPHVPLYCFTAPPASGPAEDIPDAVLAALLEPETEPVELGKYLEPEPEPEAPEQQPEAPPAPEQAKPVEQQSGQQQDAKTPVQLELFGGAA